MSDFMERLAVLHKITLPIVPYSAQFVGIPSIFQQNILNIGTLALVSLQ
jgi:hypothetical protein